jgi:bleomycin hydrolase
VLFSRERTIKNGHYWNLNLRKQNYPIGDQQSSGRCWLFSCTNILRYHLRKSKRLSYYRSHGFDLSQSYLFFYDQLEKANFYLETMIDLAQKPLDDRVIVALSQDPTYDGGSWHRAVRLVKKYGVIPSSAFPESTSSNDTETMNRLLKVKLREQGLRLRELDASIRKDERFSESSDSEVQKKTEKARLKMLHERKAQYLEEIYNILTVCMGVPPGPSDSFEWEYYRKSGNYRTWTGSPLKFRETFIDVRPNEKKDGDPLDMIGFVNDPRHEYGKILICKGLREPKDEEPATYLNVESATLQKLVIKVTVYI